MTKSLQWIRINEDVELLDTPGVLWPKLENQDDARLLALIGSINDDVLDKEDLVYFALNYLRISYPGVINKRYEVAEDENDLLEAIARKKLWLLNNNEINREKAVDQLLKDIRSSKIGRISWQDVRE